MTELFRSVADGPEPRALSRGLWARRAAMSVLALVVVLALADVFGQRGRTSRADVPQAELRVGLPDTVRGGLVFQGKIDVAARRDIEHPRLVLGTGWTEGMQINTIEPAAESEASRDGRLVLSYDKLAAGSTMTVWIQLQADPTESGRRDVTVELDDAEQPVARIVREMTVFP